MKTRHSINTPVARAVALALAVAASSQAAAQSASPADTLEEVVVTGIRHSLASSMNVKREAQGVVDGIVSEDIGKFPDTNLAESLQRISGVSIDRSIGEGSKITVRGVGPDYNLVLLNGRQMPGANFEATTVSNSRAFDFANLASEAIAGVDVYKTTRADLATGGIGATINIKTTRPLDAPGLHADFGLKGVDDRSGSRLPNSMKGKNLTPEVSGIYSDTFADNTFGIAITGSYQDRSAGYNQAGVPAGWHSLNDSAGGGWGSIAGSPNVTNRPSGIYQVPQDLMYSVNGIERKRTNGQLTLQYRPIETLTATLDYTYSENKVSNKRQELSAWFGFPNNSVSSWTPGAVSGPLSYSEPSACLVPEGPGCADVAMASSDFATKAQNKSVGFNLKWQPLANLGLELDAHDSTAVNGADGPLGSNNTLGASGYFRGTTTVDFSSSFPVMSIDLPPTLNGAIDPAWMKAVGSSFRNSYTKGEVAQVQFKGDWKINDRSQLDFGIGSTDVKNHSAYSNVEQDNWGGLGNVGQYPDSAFTLNAVRPYFSNIPGSSNSALFNQVFTWDFNAIRNAAIAVWGPGGAAQFQANPNFTTDRHTEEKSKSAFAQYSTALDIGLPAHFAAGLRYEKTDVTSDALVPIPTGNVWGSANEFTIQFANPGYTTLGGSYSYALPSVDFDVDLSSSLKARSSWSKSIGRPNWGDIQGGQTLDTGARIVGGTGSQGNPALKPLESKNIDLSLEWYYAKASYLSVGWFHKSIVNFTGYSVINATPFNIPNPGAGPWVTDAQTAGGCAAADVVCIRNYIFANHATDPAVTVPSATSGGSIAGRPGIDPATNFRITVPVNSGSSTLHGFEIALQHMLWNTGFGLAANYTYVKSDLTFDVASLGAQFALGGLSNSANVIGFYENAKWEVRLAYNWRDQFYAGNDGQGSPVFVEPYGQIDANVAYTVNEHLSFQLEGINITDRNLRSHSRTWNAVEEVTQTGARYMIGGRYKFGR